MKYGERKNTSIIDYMKKKLMSLILVFLKIS